MSQQELKEQLFNLLTQLNEHTDKIDSIIKQINSIANQLKVSSINFDSHIEQLNSIINAMKSKLKIYSTEFNNIETKSPFYKIDTADLKIHIGFKNPYGEVHTFEAQYGTTMDKLLTTYLKTIGQDPYKCDLYFEYNGNNLYVGDYTKIEKIFSNAIEPTVIVKKYEPAQENIIVNQENQVYQEDYNNNNYNYGY